MTYVLGILKLVVEIRNMCDVNGLWINTCESYVVSKKALKTIALLCYMKMMGIQPGNWSIEVVRLHCLFNLWWTWFCVEKKYHFKSHTSIVCLIYLYLLVWLFELLCHLIKIEWTKHWYHTLTLKLFSQPLKTFGEPWQSCNMLWFRHHQKESELHVDSSTRR